MATSYTSLLGLALPVTGELSGTWGDTVNNYITNYLDAAVAGVQIISGSQTAVTLSVTNGSSLVQVGAGATGSAQYGIIRCSGNPASLLTITAPAASKSYLIINATSTSQSVKIVGTGPTTGVTLVSGESAVVAWNGTDFIKVSSSAVDGVSTFSAGTTGFTPSTATSGAVTLAGTLATTNGGTGLTSFTANRVFYSSSTSAIGQSANLTFDGSTLTATTTSGIPLVVTGTGNVGARIVGGTGAGLGSYLSLQAQGGNAALIGTEASIVGSGTSTNLMLYGYGTNSIIMAPATAEVARFTSTGLSLTATSDLTLNKGTANGVAYLNGSKVLTTGSALTFDGQTLTNTRDTPILNLNDTAAGNVALRLLSTGGLTYIQSGISGGAFASIAFTANGGGSEQMRLTSTGLGIGTSSPGAKLEVSAASNARTLTVATGAAGTSNGAYYDLKGAATTAGTAWYRTLRALDESNNLRWMIGQYGDPEDTICFFTGPTPTKQMTLNSSGNLGLGVTPSAWFSSYKALQVNTNGSLTSNTDFFAVSNNAFVNTSGNDIYLTTGFAGRYRHVASNGAHQWYTAPSGTAGNAITFTQAMTLDANGRWVVGSSSPSSLRATIEDNGNQLRIRNTATRYRSDYAVISDGSAEINVFDDTGGVYMPMRLAANTIAFQTGSGTVTERARITSGGDLLVGTTSGSGDKIYASGYIRASSGFKTDGTTWIDSPASETMRFVTNNTERARIDSSGNLLVGTTSALTSASGRGNVTINGTDAVLAFGNSNSSAGYVYAASTNLEISAASTRYINFLTNGSERARITSGGFFKASNSGTYAGSTASYHELYSNASGDWIGYFTQATATNPNGVVIQYTAAAPNGTGNTFLYCQDNAAVRATIRSNGGLANYSANNVNLSDRREKTNFAPAKSYLDTICAIPVQTFNYIDQSENDPGLTLGVVAQDVQAVAPELVMESNWGTEDNPKMRLSVYQTDLQYALMKALQELKSELDSVKAELATLKGA